MPPLRNTRHEAFAVEIAKGVAQVEAARAAGYKGNNLDSVASRLVRNSQVAVRIQEIQSSVAEKAEWDAARVLIRLGEQDEADILDIQDDKGNIKPLDQWPLVWRKMVQGLKVKREKVRSTDGVQAGENRAWDETGAEILEIKFIDRLKNLQLLGSHKAVDAFVQQKQGDVNVLVVTADKARQIASAKQRLNKVIPVKCQQ